MQRFIKMKSLLDAKCAANLRLLATKNNINRISDYHYLNLAVTNSTEPVNGIDYIHPVVKPVVDYASAVITKGLAQNGEINFEFVPDNEQDEEAARQATNMVHKLINQNNDPHFILQHWDVSLVKIAVPNMLQQIADRAIQVFGAMGGLEDAPIHYALSYARLMRIGDGPDEVHLRQVFRMETPPPWGIADSPYIAAHE